MPQSVSTFLMFQGQAAAALSLYQSIFPQISPQVVKHPDKPAAMAGQILRAEFELLGQHFTLYDSPPVHDFNFTPSISIFLTVNEAEFEPLFTALSANGRVLMPPDNYGFSQRFAWFEDPFRVSWQLNLP